MEEEILQELIRDRETQIKVLQNRIDWTTVKIDKIKGTLESVSQETTQQHVQVTLNLEQCMSEYSKAVEHLQLSLDQLHLNPQRDQQPNEDRFHLYMDIVKEIMLATTTTSEGEGKGEGEDSSSSSVYVLRMQAQLCKAMHSMGMMEIQLKMIQNASIERQKQLKEVITHTMDEKSHVELKIMNDLILGGDALREVEEKHKEMVAEFSKQKDALLEKIEKQQEKNEDDEEGGDQDDEDEKEELKEVLKEGKEEVDRMEADNKAELKTLLELKAKVAAIRGELFVDELMASIAEDYKQEEEEEEEYAGQWRLQ